jgi:hypothetical protein
LVWGHGRCGARWRGDGEHHGTGGGRRRIRGVPRNNLNLDYVPAGVSGDAARPDNIVYTPGTGWEHPVCSAAATMIAATLPPVK